MSTTIRNTYTSNLHIGPIITTRGLVSCWDAASVYSYPRTGTKWYDLITRNANDGSLYNMSDANFNTDGMGSFAFDGTDDYITVPDDPSIDVGTGSFTVTAWIKVNKDIDTFDYMYVVGKRGLGASAGAGWMIQIKPEPVIVYPITPTKWRFSGTGIEDSSGTAVSFPTSVAQFDIDVWTHIALTYDRGQTSSIYANGSEVMGMGIPTLNSLSNSIPLEIGATNYWNAQHLLYLRPFVGSISSVHYYNTALSSQEIKRNYDTVKGRFGL